MSQVNNKENESGVDLGKEIHKLFQMMDTLNASDLHIKTGAPPILRIAGTVRSLEAPPLKPAQARQLITDILNEKQARTFEEKGSVDFAYSIKGLGRFRVNVFLQRDTVSMAARRVQTDIPSFKDLHLPEEAMTRIGKLKQGLVLVAGVTGCGKSTTLAALINYINEHRRCHILTLEEPIEFLHRDKQAFINQREVGLDVETFHDGLRYLVRQDPDVILIGEMRDQESFTAALSAAETGHLVFGSFHASNCPQSIGRILDFFPSERQSQVRQGLAFNLRAIFCQQLLPSIRKDIDRVPAMEIMFGTPTVQRLIQDNEDKKLGIAIMSGKEDGMQNLNQSLYQLVQSGFISKKQALHNSPNAEQLKMNFQGIFLDDDKQIVG